ncbi:hypothetical protein QA596_01015 [Balneolales bacterium ANBcel1]|nr:hypothetical protein [Balneolales bacterium ANBcel1]
MAVTIHSARGCRCKALLFAALVAVMPAIAEAQFLRLSFEIDSELTAEEMTPLNFGAVVPNSGIIRIELGDPNMGTYAITGPQNLMVDVVLEIPEYLESAEAPEFRVPLTLDVGFANRNQNNIDHLQPITGAAALFPIREDAPQQASPDTPVPVATAYIYVYGEIDVGDIPAGVYDAEVFMAVEYH